MTNKAEARKTLEDARWLLSDPSAWTKRSLTQPAYGKVPTRYCALGALRHVDGTGENEAKELLLQVARKWGYHSVETMNDAALTSHETILAAFDEAIAKTK